jgi:hypothetical protein
MGCREEFRREDELPDCSTTPPGDFRVPFLILGFDAPTLCDRRHLPPDGLLAALSPTKSTPLSVPRAGSPL